MLLVFSAAKPWASTASERCAQWELPHTCIQHRPNRNVVVAGDIVLGHTTYRGECRMVIALKRCWHRLTKDQCWCAACRCCKPCWEAAMMFSCGDDISL